MTEVVHKRLYVGGLSNNVSADQISERFSRFGQVSDLTMKYRKDEDGNCIKVFAHLNLEGSEENIKKCFSTYQNTKWKGSVLKLQFAKESFLSRLEKEREEEKTKSAEKVSSVKSAGEWHAPEIKLNGPAVPGTPVPDKKDWIVGKYGRVLPILNVKKSYKFKAIKHDPSKLCHAARVFKNETAEEPPSAKCDNLTWEIEKPDSEITKKRKGEFLISPKKKKSKMLDTLKVLNSIRNDDFSQSSQPEKGKAEEFEVVKIGYNSKSPAERDSALSRFDSDCEEDNDYMDSGEIYSKQKNMQNRNQKKMSASKEKKTIKNLQRIELEKDKDSVRERTKDSHKTSIPIPEGDKTEFSQLPKQLNVNLMSGSNSIVNDQRKVPEFAGLGMLLGSSPVETSSDKCDRSQAEKGLKREKEKSSGKEKKKTKVSVTPIEHIKDSSFKDKEICINTQILTNKVLNKKRKYKNTHDHVCDFSDEISAVSLDKEVGYDSASSADTDEIIARCKGGNKSTLKANKRQTKPLCNDSFLTQSLDLSEFSASAPEIPCNSFNESTCVNSMVDSDSYDSDLDSNDFELVAKKLAQKAKKAKLSAPNHSQLETVSPAISESSSRKPTSEKRLEKAEKSIPIVDQTISPVTKKAKVLQNTVALQKTTSLQSRLLGIASSTVKPSNSKTSQNKVNRDKHAADNEKRLLALNDRQKVKEQQQQIVKAALENVDNAGMKRIVFSSSDENEDGCEEIEAEGPKSMFSSTKKSQKTNMEKVDSLKNSPSKLQLLDSPSEDESDSNYEDMFRSKPQFEGKKGEKLMAMQRKINDSRFQLDEKFVESEDSDDEESLEETSLEEKSFVEEKKMNLEVLEKVVGKSKMDQFTAKLKKKTKHIIDMNTVRFDPTKIKTQDVALAEVEEEESMDESEQIEEEAEMKETVQEKSGSVKSNVTMSSSLVDMLKDQAKEGQSVSSGNDSFSLLQQFDQNMEVESSCEEDSNDVAKESDKLPIDAPLSGLLKPKGKIDSSPLLHEDGSDATKNSGEVDSLEDSDTDSHEEALESDEEGSSGEGSSEASESSEESDISKESENSDGVESIDEATFSVPASNSDATEGIDEAESSETDESLDAAESSEEAESPGKMNMADSGKKEEKLKKETKDGMKKEKETINKKSMPTGTTNFIQDFESSSEEEDAQDRPKDDDLKEITSALDPKEERQKLLLSAGRTDIRFSKEEWLERWDEIRTDLMKLCRRKHKDAGKRKRDMNEKKRKKDFLKNIKRKPWLKR